MEVQRQWEQHVFRAELEMRSKEESMARKMDKSRSVSDVATRNVLEMLGVKKEDAAMAAAVAKEVHSQRQAFIWRDVEAEADLRSNCDADA